MNKYCTDINFGVPLVKDLKILDRFKNTHHHLIANKETQIKFLNPDLYNIFDSLNLHIWLITIFYKIPDASNHVLKRYNIHVDLDPNIPIDNQIRDVSKINWIYNAGDSAMNWYKLKPHSKEELIKTSVNTHFLKYEREDVDLLYSKSLTSSHIVQVGIPHDVTNITEPRLCVSIALSFKDNPIKRPTMADSLEIFKDFII